MVVVVAKHDKSVRACVVLTCWLEKGNSVANCVTNDEKMMYRTNQTWIEEEVVCVLIYRHRYNSTRCINKIHYHDQWNDLLLDDRIKLRIH